MRNSGKVIDFSFHGESFATEPKSYFYNWLYINALQEQLGLARQLLSYNAFTDIAFNPKKSLNCQAEAAAIYVSLQDQDLLRRALRDKQSFLEIVYHMTHTVDQIELFQ